jgi:isoleucyl-tRNA synthetase
LEINVVVAPYVPRAGTSAGAGSGIAVGGVRAEGTKCERCWFYSPHVGQDAVHSTICLRCANAVVADKYEFATE